MVLTHLILDEDERMAVMQKNERGVQSSEHQGVREFFEKLRLDDLGLFQTVSNSQSLREAAVKLSLSVNTVRNRVSRLEKTLGSTLFVRGRGGVSITQEGLEILDIALEVQTLRSQIPLGRGNNMVVRPGQMRIGCSEGIGEFWLTPKLSELQRLLPNLTISLYNDFDQERIHSGEHDLRISFSRPTEKDVIVSRLATLHFMLYASASYIEESGELSSLNDVTNHRFVMHDAPGLNAAATALFVGQQISEKLIAVKVNTSCSLYWSVANGTGIGALPTYVRAVSKKVVPLNVPVQLKFDLWLSYDPAFRRSQPIRKAIVWLRDCFDSRRFPWFSEEFIHPDAFEDKLHDANFVSIFE
jgi:DNA-binding transcriptional LysR family regulator